MFTHPALALLGKRKFIGGWRKQLRRTKTLKGAVFAIMGVLLMIFWLGGTVLSQFMNRRVSQPGPAVSPENAILLVQGGLSIFLILNIVSSLGHRGLYIPKDEIDILFSAPVSRGQIVRYRVIVNLLKSMIGALIMSMVMMNRAPDPLYGFFGAFIAMQTLPLIGQIMSILSGDAENRWISRIPKGAIRTIIIILAIGTTGLVGFLFMPSGKMLGKVAAELVNNEGTGFLQMSFIKILLTPAKPWAAMITATSAQAFALWATVSVGIWCVLFYIVGKLNIDFRELSLETSADIAKRLNRVRRGSSGGANATKPKLTGWRMPWFFGHGTFGAITWRKSLSIARRARATLLISFIIIGLVSVVFSLISMNSRKGIPEPALSILFCVFGSIYLCNSLRFDFREDLEKMETLKASPASNFSIFTGTLVPQTALVTVLMTFVLIIKSAVMRTFHPALPGLICAVPLFTFCWIAIDNIVFLMAPTRMVAGQDTMLQNAGRTFILMMARLFISSFSLAIACIPIGIALLVENYATGIELSTRHLLVWVGVALSLSIGLAETAFIAWIGARTFARFDVSADRG